MDTFAAKKSKLLQQLEVPESEYHDASPKGSVDENIRDLVSEINCLDDMVTTSSCGGRIAVYLEGPPKTSSGGKGGGRWLFTSHRPIELPATTSSQSLHDVLGLEPANDLGDTLAPFGPSRFVHFKFEPLILHILTRSNETAQKVLSAAMDAGYRESGISGVATSNPHKPVLPMVAVRTAGLAFDCIIAQHEGTDDAEDVAGRPRSMVSEAYLSTLIRIANDRFVSNDERKERFRTALQVRTAPELHVPKSTSRRTREGVDSVTRYDLSC